MNRLVAKVALSACLFCLPVNPVMGGVIDVVEVAIHLENFPIGNVKPKDDAVLIQILYGKKVIGERWVGKGEDDWWPKDPAVDLDQLRQQNIREFSSIESGQQFLDKIQQYKLNMPESLKGFGARERSLELFTPFAPDAVPSLEPVEPELNRMVAPAAENATAAFLEDRWEEMVDELEEARWSQIESEYVKRFVIKLRRPIPEWDTDHAAVRVFCPDQKGWRFRLSVIGSLVDLVGVKSKTVADTTISFGKTPVASIQTNTYTDRRASGSGVKTILQDERIDTYTQPGGQVSRIETTERAGNTVRQITEHFSGGEVVEFHETVTVIQPIADGSITTTLDIEDGQDGRVIRLTKETESGDSTTREVRSRGQKNWLKVELLRFDNKRILTMGGERSFQIPGVRPNPDDPHARQNNSSDYQVTFDKVD